MTSKKRLLTLDNLFTASYNREEEWQRCCAKVMGFEWVDRFDDPNPTEPPTTANIQQLINLTDEAFVLQDQDECKHDDVDPWTATALRIQTDLQRMAQWIQSKQQEYVGLNMLDTEASIIQSTVTTFAATTASELESLRQLIPSSSGGAVTGHRNGIVQILLGQLQEEITQPFGKLQKQRTRVAVQLWQHPWQCQLVVPKAQSRGMAHLLDLDEDSADEREKRFLPRTGNPTSRSSIDFWDRYERDPLDEFPQGPQPEFLMRRWDTPGTAPPSAPSPAIQHLAPTHIHQVTTLSASTTTHSYEELQRREQEELEQEATLLQETIVQSDLDSVQKMEQRMVEITTLIGQFANLVSEQQEDIQDIAHQAQTTKQNMEKGQENLIDATERTKRSKHYMAWTIFTLSLTLLFFHTLRN